MHVAQWEDEDPSRSTRVAPFRIILDNGIVKPVERRPNATGRGPTRIHRAGGARKCIRRFHLQPVMRNPDGTFVAVMDGERQRSR
jgi:hypothetical protein